MKCVNCFSNIVIQDAKFCPECGTKVEPLPITPPRREVFSGVQEIKLNIGTEIKISPSTSDETVVTVEAPEDIKKDLTMTIKNGQLKVSYSSSSNNISVGNSNNIIISGGGVIIGRNVIGGNVISGNYISTGGDPEVVVNITTPVGVDISIDSGGNLHCTIGDLKSDVSIDTSGSCRLKAVRVTSFSADVSGNMFATIDNFEGGNCHIDSSGSCNLTITKGAINQLSIDSSGSTNLDVSAETRKAVLDIYGSISGSLHTKNIRRDISGIDCLKIV